MSTTRRSTFDTPSITTKKHIPKRKNYTSNTFSSNSHSSSSSNSYSSSLKPVRQFTTSSSKTIIEPNNNNPISTSTTSLIVSNQSSTNSVSVSDIPIVNSIVSIATHTFDRLSRSALTIKNNSLGHQAIYIETISNIKTGRKFDLWRDKKHGGKFLLINQHPGSREKSFAIDCLFNPSTSDKNPFNNKVFNLHSLAVSEYSLQFHSIYPFSLNIFNKTDPTFGYLIDSLKNSHLIEQIELHN